MRSMMLDVVQTRFQRLESERLFQLVLDAGNLHPIREPLADRTKRRTFGEDELRALKQPRVRIAIDGNVIDIIEINARFVEAIADRDRREPGPMFDAPESLLLGRGDEL